MDYVVLWDGSPFQNSPGTTKPAFKIISSWFRYLQDVLRVTDIVKKIMSGEQILQVHCMGALVCFGDNDGDNKNDYDSCEGLRFCHELAEQVNMLFIFSCSCPHCVDSQPRCSTSQLCILL